MLKLCRNRNTRRILIPALSLLNPRGVFVIRAVREGVHYLFLWQGNEASEDTANRAEVLALQMRKIFTTATVLYKLYQGSEDDMFKSFLVNDYPFDPSQLDETNSFDDYFDDAAAAALSGLDHSLSSSDSLDADNMNSTLPKILLNMAREITNPSATSSSQQLPPLRTDLLQQKGDPSLSLLSRHCACNSWIDRCEL